MEDRGEFVMPKEENTEDRIRRIEAENDAYSAFYPEVVGGQGNLPVWYYVVLVAVGILLMSSVLYFA